jgi:hypothetical protein
MLEAADICARCELNRRDIAWIARGRYSLETVGVEYDKIFQTLTDPAWWHTKDGRL